MNPLIKSVLALNIVFLMLATQTACTQTASTQSTNLDDQSKVLARVNGEAITEKQLASNVEILMGKSLALDTLPVEERKKILDSMILSRLIKQQAEKQINQAQARLYAQKAQAYKEKIIVNDYLMKNISPAPVNDEMVNAYYHKHPEKFGASQDIQYELLSTVDRLSETDRDKLLANYPTMDKSGGLQSIQARIAATGLILNYQKAHLKPGKLSDKIEATLASLQPGEASSLFMQQGRPYIIKLLTREKTPPQALAVVSNDIRKQLVPMALKVAIRAQTEQLKENAEIAYF